ncbi:MAG TPA: hypothetical protein VFJ05_04230 [Nitrososphaeraceae archaeon]|nr:hypothetical protein [Nitrososphaeraceae archaeon]
MKNVVTTFEFLPKSALDLGYSMTDSRLRYGITRNRLAAVIGFIAGILFLVSGYKQTWQFTI